LKLKQALRHGRDSLAEGSVEDARLESELLLRHTLKIDRVQLYMDLEGELAPWQEKAFKKLLKRRLGGEPSAYITGHREFYGLDFIVSPAVLIPRPESELLVEKALTLGRNRLLPLIADIGTGSGAIAISLALGLPRARIYATDISADALEVALANCRRHGVSGRVRLLKGDLLGPLREPVDIIVANLPYIRKSELNPQSEPPRALDGGAGGTEVIERLCLQAGGKLKPGGYLLLEIGQGQRQAVETILHKVFPGGKIDTLPDLAGIERVVCFSLTADLLKLDRRRLHC
jgi:release factor glutamine methyltransferase